MQSKQRDTGRKCRIISSAATNCCIVVDLRKTYGLKREQYSNTGGLKNERGMEKEKSEQKENEEVTE
jgi:hypothetical protein